MDHRLRHTLNVHEGMTCTQEQAQEWLQADVMMAEHAIDMLVTVDLTQNEFDALVDFAFNVGMENFHRSTLLRLIDQDDTRDGVLQFLRWDRAGGKVVPGLVKRREAERTLFET